MIALLAAGLASLWPSIVSAQITMDLEADIPFPSVVGTQTIAPSKYIIHRLDEQNVMELKGATGSPIVVFEFNRTEAKNRTLEI